MSDEIDAITEDDQQAVEAASGAVHFWQGKKLAAWSFERAACAERLRAFSASTSNIEAAATIVYLCTLDGDDGFDRIDSARDTDGIKAMRKAVAKWANDNKLHSHSRAGRDCCKVAHDILTAAEGGRFEVIAEKKSPGEPASSQGDSPATSRRSRKRHTEQ